MPKGRQAGDGRGRLGGRQKGTPNKEDQPLKAVLHQKSEAYFTVPVDDEGNTQFDLDMREMEPAVRAKLQMDMLQYHTPKMQSVSADMNVKDVNKTYTDRLARLARGEDIPNDTD